MKNHTAEKMASEVAAGGSVRRRATKRKSHHGTLHIPAGKDVSEELLRAYREDSDVPDDEELKAMTVTLSAKRKLR